MMQTGTDFHIRDRTLQDVDDDIDVDGEDEFGDAQFTEGDILRLSSSSGAAPAIPQQSSSAARSNRDRQHRSPDVELDLDLDIDVELTDDDERTKSLRDLVAAGKIVRSHPNLTLATSSSSIQNGVIHEVHDKINIREEIKVQIDEPIAVDTADLAIARARRAGDERALIRALESKVAHLVRRPSPPFLSFFPRHSPPSPSPFPKIITDRNPRNLPTPHQPSSAGSASTPTPSPPLPPAAGIRAVASAGSGA